MTPERRVLPLIRAATFCSAVLLVGALSTPLARADDGTATPTPSPQVEATAAPAASPIPASPTPREVPTPVVPESTATQIAPRPERTPSAKSTPGPKGHPAATPGPGKTSTSARRSGHPTRKKRQKPAPTPTATPVLSLNAEDSISPVTCNGPGKPPAPHPFLYPPYHGWTSIASFFDHDSPNFLHDGLVITATGLQASSDGVHDRSDLAAYWDPGTRQYVFYDGHNGYDYNLWYQPVYSAAAGKVIFAGFEYPQLPDRGYGKMVMIEHRGGYVTLYGHFSKVLVKRGEKVGKGVRLGISGNTGHSTGPHLHFSVFHNCTPVDPYGWSGSGPDPLQSYKGETSINVWARMPLISNPSRAWPGIDKLASTGPATVVLLRLPSNARGAPAFAKKLRAEAERVVTSLGLDASDSKIDMLQGAVDMTVPVRAGHVYAIPGVASLASFDTLAGQEADLLATLARAVLAASPPRAPLGPSRTWTAAIVSYEGQTLLVGKGTRGGTVILHLEAGRGGAAQRKVVADPKTGAYAVDLGRLSHDQVQRLRNTLEHAQPRAVPRQQVPVDVRPMRRVSSASGWSTAFELVGSFFLLSLAAAVVWQRRRLSWFSKDSRRSE
jgi:murein DD-endopeptidase MepM/ murein hydrolase activator NlpD